MALAIELVEGSEHLTVDVRQDQLPVITVGLYRLLLSRGDVGRDALQVYLFLLYTYRCQRTDRVWCANTYIQKALGMGERRVQVAKSLLTRMTLIQTVRQKDARGRVVKTFTRLNLLPNPGPSIHATDAWVEETEKSPPMQKSTPVGDRTCGPGPQLLEEIGEEGGIHELRTSATERVKEVAHAR